MKKKNTEENRAETLYRAFSSFYIPNSKPVPVKPPKLRTTSSASEDFPAPEIVPTKIRLPIAPITIAALLGVVAGVAADMHFVHNIGMEVFSIYQYPIAYLSSVIKENLVETVASGLTGGIMGGGVVGLLWHGFIRTTPQLKPSHKLSAKGNRGGGGSRG